MDRDLDLPESLRLILDTVRRFTRQELEPISDQVEEEDQIPEETVERMRELGLFGLCIPEAYGGLGLGSLGECLVWEELSRVNAAFRTRVATNNGLGSQGIVIDGTEEQKERWLPRLASGEWTGCLALSEPEAGSDAASIRTRAVRDGDEWVLSGLKHYVTNGDCADMVTVIALTDPDLRAHGGITAFVVEFGTPGLTVGHVEEKMGLRGTHTCELIFDECRVPMANVIGGEACVGGGFSTVMKVLDKGRLAIAAASLGSAQRLLELSTEHARQRVQFGRAIGKFQGVQFMLADMATEIYAARQMLHHAAALRDRRGGSVTAEASMAKLFCTEMAGRVADKAVQVHGGLGYMKSYPVERFFRDLRLTRIYEGTSEIQRLIIARELLKES